MNTGGYIIFLLWKKHHLNAHQRSLSRTDIEWMQWNGIEWFEKSQTKMTWAYLHSVERDIMNVMDDSQQTVAESGEGSAQQEDEVILIQTHLTAKITAE